MAVTSRVACRRVLRHDDRRTANRASSLPGRRRRRGRGPGVRPRRTALRRALRRRVHRGLGRQSDHRPVAGEPGSLRDQGVRFLRQTGADREHRRSRPARRSGPGSCRRSPVPGRSYRFPGGRCRRYRRSGAGSARRGRHRTGGGVGGGAVRSGHPSPADGSGGGRRAGRESSPFPRCSRRNGGPRRGDGGDGADAGGEGSRRCRRPRGRDLAEAARPRRNTRSRRCHPSRGHLGVDHAERRVLSHRHCDHSSASGSR